MAELDYDYLDAKCFMGNQQAETAKASCAGCKLQGRPHGPN